MFEHMSFKVRPVEIALCCILLLLSYFVQQGRIGASVGGVDLATDAANYAAIAAATAQPEAFVLDDVFGDAALYGAHSTAIVPLIAHIAHEDNYGLAYLKLTGLHVFLHYLAFYILGCVLFKKRWQALIFTILQGQVYWIFWGTYWGAGYIDYTPRTTFEIFYAVYIVVALALLRRPRWWPVFMAATGLLIYVHSISTLPVALGFWLGFAVLRPRAVPWARHAIWMLLCGACFLLVAAPAILHHGAPPPSLTADDVAMLREVLLTRFDAEFTYYWQAIGQFFLKHSVLPIFPLALAGAYSIRRWGDSGERRIVGQFALWTLGVLGVLGIFLIDQELARALGRHHYEFDLVRVLRFLVFFAQCVALMGLCVLMRHVARNSTRRYWMVIACYVALCAGLFVGGQQDMLRKSLAWYWHSTSPERLEAAYGPQIRRAAMLKALMTHTEPGASIFYPREDLAIRYIALRSLTHSWKDVGVFYYAKNVAKLRKWLATHTQIQASPTSYIEAARHSGAQYVLSDRPQDAVMLKTLGPLVWEGEGYLLLRLAKAGES